MTVTAASFANQFEAFSDPSVYDPDDVAFYINLAYSLLNPGQVSPPPNPLPSGWCEGRWGAQLDYGCSLFVAHHLMLAARDNAATRAGGIPGTVEGVRTAKSVDKVAASYDANSVILKDGAYWNSTSFGIRFLQLARWMGSGPQQVNGRFSNRGWWGGGLGWP